MHRLGFYLCWYNYGMNHKDILESSRIGKWKYSSTHVLKRHLLWRSYTFLIRSYTFREASSLWFCFGSCRPSCSEVIRSYTFLYVPCNPLSKSLQSCPEAIRSYTFRATLSLNAISPAMKLYVPIRSVQPSRNSVKLLYVPIRSYYVPIRSECLCHSICNILIRSYTFRATLSRFCEIVIRSYTFLLRSYTFRLVFLRCCTNVVCSYTFRATPPPNHQQLYTFLYAQWE